MSATNNACTFFPVDEASATSVFITSVAVVTPQLLHGFLFGKYGAFNFECVRLVWLTKSWPQKTLSAAFSAADGFL